MSCRVNLLENTIKKKIIYIILCVWSWRGVVWLKSMAEAACWEELKGQYKKSPKILRMSTHPCHRECLLQMPPLWERCWHRHIALVCVLHGLLCLDIRSTWKWKSEGSCLELNGLWAGWIPSTCISLTATWECLLPSSLEIPCWMLMSLVLTGEGWALQTFLHL